MAGKNTKIQVVGLSARTEKDTLTNYFAQFGEIQEVAVIRDEFTGRSKDWVVTFKCPEAAAKACQDKFPIIDGTIACCNFVNLDKRKTSPLDGLCSTPFPNQQPQYTNKDSPPLDDLFSTPFSNQQPQYINQDSPMDMDWEPWQDMTNPHRNVRTKMPTLSSPRMMNPWMTGGFSDHKTIKMPIKIREMAKILQCGEARDKNFVFSPCSIHLALSLLSNGSNGSTLSELLMFLDAKDLDQLNSDATKQIDSLTGTTTDGGLSFVGGLWVENSLKLSSTFKEKAEKTYRAQAKQLDFMNDIQEAIREVNSWAEEATNGLIKSILPENLDRKTVIVLGNAVYFKSKWSEKFNKHYTRDYPFYLSDQIKTREILDEPAVCKRVTVPFMTSTESQQINCCKNFKVLKLPYECKSSHLQLSMYIILPNQVHGIWDLIEAVGSDPLFFDTYVGRYDCKFVDVREFRIPKFKVTTDFEASDVLKRIGLEEPFSDRAEFDQIVPGVTPGRLRVSKVLHKAYIQVDEEGTEAAAVTAITMGYESACAAPVKRPTVDFVADHPFMFIVRDDQSGTVLFMGHVMNPLF